MTSEAYLSDDRKYRYWLLRRWDHALPIMANIGANPSTADELSNDPTIRKDIGFAMRNGFGGLLKLNLGAYRATDPRKWYVAADPFGKENTPGHLRGFVEKFGADVVVAAWGRAAGRFAYRGLKLREVFPKLHCFGMLPDGTPRHTLMLPYTTKMELWR